MFGFVAKKIFGTKNARVLSGMRPAIARIAAMESELQAKSDVELQAMTPELRRQLAAGAKDEQIARTLGLSLRTVRRRVAELMIDLGNAAVYFGDTAMAEEVEELED